MNMPLVLMNRRRRAGGFSPYVALFANDERGVFLDPSDTANLSWRRNLLTWSEQFDNTAWTKGSATISANSSVAPDGTTTADTLVSAAATAATFAQQNITSTAVTHTFSIYVKASGATFVQLLWNAPASSNHANFDLVNGTVTAGTYVAATITPAGNAWYRISITSTLASTSVTANAYIIDNGSAARGASYTGNGTSGILIWGAQLELGSTASTYQLITDVNTEVRANFPNATLFQDPAGTTPVTTPGQSVALALDKSRGLVLGSELVTNGDFSSGSTGWSSTSWVISGGVATITNALDSLVQNVTLIGGRTYSVTYTLSGFSGTGAFRPRFFGGTTVTGTSVSANGTYTEYLTAVSGNNQLAIATTTATCTGTVDNISVRELPGNHATQATAGSRPLYALLPANGVRNLANGSASVGDVNFWSASQVISGITAARVASGIDVDGLPYFDVRMTGTATGTSRDIAYLNGASRQAASVGQSFTASVTAQLIAGSATGISGVQVASVEETAPSTFVNLAGSAVTVSTSETLLSATRTIATGNQARCAVVLLMNNGATIDVTYRIKALQFELGSTRTAYQFNYSNVNIAQPPFAQVGALLFDGVDDFLQTPSVDFAGYEQLGSELVTNGDFSSGTTGWILIGTGSARAIVAGEMEVTATAGNFAGTRQTISGLTIGAAYRVTGTARQGTTTNIVRVQFGAAVSDVTTTTNTPVSLTFIATATSHNIDLSIANAAGNGTAYFDNISVKEVLRPADKMTVFAGVRKLSDAARASIAELGAGGTGSFRVEGPGSSGAANYAAAGGGTVVTGTTIGSQASPNTAVVTGAGDISGDLNTIRLNGGALTSSSTADQGTGNYAAGQLFIGRRSGSSNPFNGYLYSLIVRGAATPSSLITQTEQWVNQRTGAY